MGNFLAKALGMSKKLYRVAIDIQVENEVVQQIEVPVSARFKGEAESTAKKWIAENMKAKITKITLDKSKK